MQQRLDVNRIVGEDESEGETQGFRRRGVKSTTGSEMQTETDGEIRTRQDEREENEGRVDKQVEKKNKITKATRLRAGATHADRQ